MIQLDYKSGIPIYDQLINGIIRLKMFGALKGGDALPSVRSLAQKLGINPNTVQKAYAILEERGVIYSVTGKGSFIADDSESDKAVMNIALNEFKKAVLEAKRKGLPERELLEVVNKLYKEEDK